MGTHEHKIDHLDQGYYGPTIPPKDPDTPRRLRVYALLCTAFHALTLALIAVGVVTLVLPLVFQPYVDSALFTRFDLGTGGNGTTAQLHYDLTVALSTMEIRPRIDDQSPVAAAAASLKREKGEGFFNINVKLYMRVRLNVAMVNSVVYSPDVDCCVRVPDPDNATAVAQVFAATECHVDDFP